MSEQPIPASLRDLTVPIASLKHYSKNPRQGDVGAIMESLRVNGQYRPVVVNRRTDEVLAGNHTLKAARELGWSEIAATFVDVDEFDAARIALVDNRANDLAAYDDHSLLDLISSLPSLEGTGFDEDAIDELLRVVDPPSEGADTDAGDLPGDPASKPGELFALGEHRLLCGDSTKLSDVRVLMSDEEADAMWTDPPYGVSYVGKTKDALTIENDGADGLPDLLRDAFSAAVAVLKPGAAVYCSHPAGRLSLDFTIAFNEAFDFRQGLVWNKDVIVLGHSDYHYSHEPILYGYTSGYEGRRGRGGEGWYGDASQASVITVPKPSRSTEHPTSKPVELIERCLLNSTRTDHLVYEPFAGSGSTIIACENLSRRCNAVELDPAYCDVIIDRWERHTGRKAEKLNG